MPELPEVEITRRGLSSLLAYKRVDRIVIRERRLRWSVPECLSTRLPGQRFRAVERCAKYLLLRFETGTLIFHLGMSGSLRWLQEVSPPERHDHLDLVFVDQSCLRFRDPRRFGAALWTEQDPLQHPLLAPLGIDPLEKGFRGEGLYRRSRGRKLAVKSFLMDGHVIAGIGNIYANEALFLAGIYPGRPAGQISMTDYRRLAGAIRQVLLEAIAQGGTTLRDFQGGDGRPGYFARYLRVYGCEGRPCSLCGLPLQAERQNGRASYYCPHCQQ